MIHLEVAVAVPLEHTLTYALVGDTPAQEGSNHDKLIGRRVLVPLGRRQVTGYVVAIVDPIEATTYQIRQISALPDGYPLFHPNIVPFFKWVAEYYHYALGLVIKAALPGGLAPRSITRFVLRQRPVNPADLGYDPMPAWLLKLISDGELSPGESAQVIADPAGRKMCRKLLSRGLIEQEQVLQRDGVREKVETVYCSNLSDHLASAAGKNGQDLAGYRLLLQRETGKILTKSETRALLCLESLCRERQQPKITLKELKLHYSGAAAALSSLAQKDLVQVSRQRMMRSPLVIPRSPFIRPTELTAQQQEVLEQILPAIRGRAYAPFLLHGVTGSGKTEVYLQATQVCLAEGRDVLILVPEIALATQLEAQLLDRFGELVVLQHSGLSAAEKLDQYFLALTGRAKLVIGARSAIFAPLLDPGLIIVDEEHDSGFKQDDSFCYHGRDLAVLRAKHHQAVVILGSATPSVTSYAHAVSSKYQLLELPERIAQRPLPTVQTVDLNIQPSGDKGRIIGAVLLGKLIKTLAQGKQAILLLNRRGFSTVLLCQNCGTAVQCSHCHVSLTVHKGKNRLVCHYCGFSRATDTACVQCRSVNLVPVGFGTERVEEEVGELLPAARVQRLDSDTAADRRAFLRVLADMHNGEIDILIGTQMIAKGHHFPNVTLVGVVWADGGMNLPDFRAAERTFQLITQVTGRAGRGDSPGEVIIQTMRPEHYALRYARDHQYLQMFEHEMRLRRHPAFPPYVRLVALRVEARGEIQAQDAATRIARFCRNKAAEQRWPVETLGPAPSPLDKIKDRYRWQVLLKGQGSAPLQSLCTALRERCKDLVGPGCKLVVDVDPENMM